MNSKEFGRIIRDIRESILFLTQDQLAYHLKCNQPVISRLERGKGTNQLVFDILEYLTKRNIKAHMIFYIPFSLNNLKNDPDAIDSNI